MNPFFWRAHLRRLWEQRLDRLEAYLHELKQREEDRTNGAKNGHNGHRSPPDLDHPDDQRPT